jgi:hypothetical protein
VKPEPGRRRTSPKRTGLLLRISPDHGEGFLVLRETAAAAVMNEKLYGSAENAMRAPREKVKRVGTGTGRSRKAAPQRAERVWKVMR